MVLTHCQEQGVDIVGVAGRLALAEVAEARGKLKDLAENGTGKLIIDLSATTFMDSGGLSVLISAFKAVQNRKGRMALAAPTPNIQSLIELTRLQQIFEIFQTREAGIAALAKS
jgi:anti-sigma B factor antagonist